MSDVKQRRQTVVICQANAMKTGLQIVVSRCRTETRDSCISLQIFWYRPNGGQALPPFTIASVFQVVLGRTVEMNFIWWRAALNWLELEVVQMQLNNLPVLLGCRLFHCPGFLRDWETTEANNPALVNQFRQLVATVDRAICRATVT